MRIEVFCTAVAVVLFSISSSAAPPLPERSGERTVLSMNPADFEKVGSVYRDCRQRTWSQEVKGAIERRSKSVCEIYRSKDYKGPISINPMVSEQ